MSSHHVSRPAQQLATAAIATTNPVAGRIATVAHGQRAGRLRLWRATAAVLLLPSLGLLAIVSGAATSNPTCANQPVTIFDGDLSRVLATIRAVESGGNYQAKADRSTASGAYQFLDSSWANCAGYSRAWLAPPHVQDVKAAEWVTVILQHHHGDVATVPVIWYIGHLPPAGDTEWDTVPHPEDGNALTPRQYQAKWINVYNNPTAAAAVDDGPEGPTCLGVVGQGSYTVPGGVDPLVASRISWGGYSNGRIPHEAMRYSPHSGYLYPTASTAWDQLYAAALNEGYDLRGSGYRPAAAGGATAGRSNHGWGLAIDIRVLVVGNHYPTANTAFASDEYAWLAANAPRYGWINPTWAKPPAWGGTGTGGHIGNQCCFLEPWHWEWAAFSVHLDVTVGPS